MSLPEKVAAIRAEYDQCFGCGRGNEIGLHIDGFARTDNKVRAVFVPKREFNGFSDVLHGGIVATALDEIMAWTAILVEGVMVVTGTLDLRFRKPARATASFALEGELVNRRGRRIHIDGRMMDGATTVAEATGLFLVAHEID